MTPGVYVIYTHALRTQSTYIHVDSIVAYIRKDTVRSTLATCHGHTLNTQPSTFTSSIMGSLAKDLLSGHKQEQLALTHVSRCASNRISEVQVFSVPLP